MGWVDSLRLAYSPARAEPWALRKFWVGFLLALIVWSCYVVIGRACTPLIQRDSDTGLSRADGIGVLTGYVIVFLIFGWSYLKMIFTGPGRAVLSVPKSPPPHDPTDASRSVCLAPLTENEDLAAEDNGPGPDPSTLGPVGNGINQALQRVMSGTTAVPHGPQNHGSVEAPPNASKQSSQLQRPVPRVHYGVRWCRFCEINKPDRTHHCRHCGTCVLQFDHHCVWIGQCVGWANHKFFIIFTFWAAVYCLYIIVFLAVYAQRSTSVDGQIIGLIAVAGLFGSFTMLMFATHVYLIVTGRTTIESYQSRDQEEQESRVLQTEFGVLRHNREKRKVKRRWREEWGDVPVDARWRWGSNMDMWKQEMGDEWLSWILPYGRPKGDGIHFRSNPYFGPNGEWLRKEYWPQNRKSSSTT